MYGVLTVVVGSYWFVGAYRGSDLLQYRYIGAYRYMYVSGAPDVGSYVVYRYKSYG